MSDKMLITSGSSFEGYKIEEYLGFVSGHSILGSNFMSGIAANVTDVARKDTAKLEQCREDAGAKIVKAAEKKGANAIIGVNMNYAPFEAGSFGIITSGTAVRVSKIVEVDNKLHKELFVTNYYTRLVPRPVKVILDGDINGISLKMDCYNYNNDDILALRADVEFTNLYEERLVIKNVDFVFSSNNNQSLISSDYIQETVARYFNIDKKDLITAKRSTDITYPRQIAMYLCRTIGQMSLPKIGEDFGKRDHTTVMHAVKKIEKEIKDNPNSNTKLIVDSVKTILTEQKNR